MPFKGKRQINILKLISKTKILNSLPSKIPYPPNSPSHLIIQIRGVQCVKLFADVFLVNRFDTL